MPNCQLWLLIQNEVRLTMFQWILELEYKKIVILIRINLHYATTFIVNSVKDEQKSMLLILRCDSIKLTELPKQKIEKNVIGTVFKWKSKQEDRRRTGHNMYNKTINDI